MSAIHVTKNAWSKMSRVIQTTKNKSMVMEIPPMIMLQIWPMGGHQTMYLASPIHFVGMLLV